MDLNKYSKSEGFFEFDDLIVEPGVAAFDSFRGRLLSLGAFFEKLAIVPFAFLFKLYRTFFRAIGLLGSGVLLAFTICSSPVVRDLFVRRMTFLAKDLADWVIWPVAVAICLCRLLLAALVHPALYLGI